MACSILTQLAAFLTELKKITAATPAALNMEPARLYSPLGVPTEYYVMSLDGLPAEQIACMRRVRVHSTKLLSQEELLLEASNQLVTGQGADVYQHHVATVAGSNPKHMKKDADMDLIRSFAQVHDKGEEMAEKLEAADVLARQQAETAMQDAPLEEKGKEVTSRVVQGAGTKHRKTKSAAKEGSKKGEKSGKTSVKGESESQFGMSEAMGSLTTMPKALKDAAQRLQSVPQCFGTLSVEALLEGRPIGRSLQGVRA